MSHDLTGDNKMENWFTVKKIDKDTFAISEYKHWEETHCYLLYGTASHFNRYRVRSIKY